MSKSRKLYISINFNNKRNVVFLTISPNSKQIVVSFVFNKKNEFDNPINIHITRHTDFLHETYYKNGKPIDSPLRSIYEEKCVDINNLYSYELIASIEVSPIIFYSELYPDYTKDKRKILYTIENPITDNLIHIFIQPKNYQELYLELDKYKKSGLNYVTKELDCLNCDIVCVCIPINSISPNSITNASGMYRKLMKDKSNLQLI